MRARHAAVAALAIAAGIAGLTAAGPASGIESPLPADRVVPLGESLRGRPIGATRIGDPASPNKALVVGVIHGDERAGLRITRALKREFADLTGIDIWIVDSLNPDGQAARDRGNARGVDLNRNFPHRWRSIARSSGYYSGPRALSEPEPRLAIELIEALQPRVSVWYHQPWGKVLVPCGGQAPIQRAYARAAGMATGCRGDGLPGTAISWQNSEHPGTTAFVVELKRGELSKGAALRHARSLVEVAVSAFS